MADAWTVYKSVTGVWTVPKLQGDDGSELQEMAYWVGLDGWYDDMVVQSGTIALIAHLPGVDIAGYAAWVEWYPDAMQSIMTVNAGDTVSPTVIAENAGSASVSFEDPTSNSYWTGTISPPFGYGLPLDPSVSSAEWIVENPNNGGQDLADYGTTILANGLAKDTNNTYYYPYTSPNQLFDMFSSSTGDLLSHAYFNGCCTLTFVWKNFN